MYYFIVNPRSSSGRGRKLWKKIKALLLKDQIPYKVSFTRGPKHAAELAKELSGKHPSAVIVAVGGDGTANEVIDGLTNLSTIRFGYIPTGSGNDLARGLSLPTDPAHALRAIVHPMKIQQISLGILSSGQVSRRFIVSGGIGFDAAVCHEALDSGLKNLLNRFHLGKLTYLGIALKQLLLLRPDGMTLTLDDETVLSLSGVLFAAFMNLKYEGGGFMFCPEANGEDELLDLCVVERMPRLKILALLPTAFFGKHTKYNGIRILRCQKVQIHSSRPLPVHTDGEAFGICSDLTVSLHKERLSFITG